MTGEQQNSNRVFIGMLITVLTATAITGVIWYRSQNKDTKDKILQNDTQILDHEVECKILQDSKEKFLKSAHTSYDSDKYVQAFVKHYVDAFKTYVHKHNVNLHNIELQEVRDIVLQLAEDNCNLFADVNTQNSKYNYLQDVNSVRSVIVNFLCRHSCLAITLKKYKSHINKGATTVSNVINAHLADPRTTLGLDVAMFNLVYAAYIENENYVAQVAYTYTTSTLTQIAYSPSCTKTPHMRTLDQKGTFLNKLVLLNSMIDVVFEAISEQKPKEYVYEQIYTYLGRVENMQLLSNTNYIAQFLLQAAMHKNIQQPLMYVKGLIAQGKQYSAAQMYAQHVHPSVVIGNALSLDTEGKIVQQMQKVLEDITKLDTKELQLLHKFVQEPTITLDNTLQSVMHSLWQLEHRIFMAYITHNNIPFITHKTTKALQPLNGILRMHLNEFNTHDVQNLRRLFKMKDLTGVTYDVAHPGKLITLLDLDSKTGDLHSNMYGYKTVLTDIVLNNVIKCTLDIVKQLK